MSTKLDLDLFISDELSQRAVALPGGKTFLLHFRQLENVAFEQYLLESASDNFERAAAAPAVLIAKGLANPDGSPALTVEEARRLKRPVLSRLIKELYAANGYGVEAAKAQEAEAKKS